MAKRRKKRVLSEVDVDEVSLVDKPATGYEFYVVKRAEDGVSDVVEVLKQKTKINITSDGTVKGTVVKVNGREVTDLVDFGLSFYDGGMEDQPIHMTYTVRSRSSTRAGFKTRTTYVLSKQEQEALERGEELPKATDEDKGKIRAFFDDDIDVGDLTECQGIFLSKSLGCLQDYRDVFPKEVAEAVSGLAEIAVGKAQEPITTGVAKKEGDEDVADKEDDDKGKDTETAATEPSDAKKEEPAEAQPDIAVTATNVIADLIHRGILVVAGQRTEKEDSREEDSGKPNSNDDKGKSAGGDAGTDDSDDDGGGDDPDVEISPEELAEIEANIAGGGDGDIDLASEAGDDEE